jgi:hypothetical protein
MGRAVGAQGRDPAEAALTGGQVRKFLFVECAHRQ